MVWGAISAASLKSQLMLWNTGEYSRKAGFPQLKSCFLKRSDQMLFFNKTMLLPTPKTKTWLENKSIRLMFCPSHSPGFNPIDNIWPRIKTQTIQEYTFQLLNCSNQ